MTLTDPEVRHLLGTVMAYDNRKPGTANVAAWTEAARRGRWTLPEALEAVHAHFAERADWLMPGMVTQHIKAARQDRAMREPTPAPNPLGQAKLRELTADAYAAIGSAEPDDTRRGALSRPCSYCSAIPGKPCTRRGLTGRVRLANVHPTRLEATA